MEPRCSHTVQAGFSRHLEQHSCVEAVLSPFGAPRVPPLPTCAAVVIKCRNPRPGVTPVVAGHEPPAFGVALLCIIYISPSTCACAVAGRGGMQRSFSNTSFRVFIPTHVHTALQGTNFQF